MVRPRILDYVLNGKVVIPLLFLESADYLAIIDACDAGKLEIKQKIRKKGTN